MYYNLNVYNHVLDQKTYFTKNLSFIKDVSFINVFKWANPDLFFVYFRPFLSTISIIQIEISLDGVLGIWTRDCRMVGTDKTTKLKLSPILLLKCF